MIVPKSAFSTFPFCIHLNFLRLFSVCISVSVCVHATFMHMPYHHACTCHSTMLARQSDANLLFSPSTMWSDSGPSGLVTNTLIIKLSWWASIFILQLNIFFFFPYTFEYYCLLILPLVSIIILFKHFH